MGAADTLSANKLEKINGERYSFTPPPKRPENENVRCPDSLQILNYSIALGFECLRRLCLLDPARADYDLVLIGISLQLIERDPIQPA